MPVHDWSRVQANRFHDFHPDWMVEIRRELNRNVLPSGYVAMVEQVTGGPEPDVVTLTLPKQPSEGSRVGMALVDQPIRTQFQSQADEVRYAQKVDQIRIYHPDGKVIAILEIVSPGNKSRRDAIRAFTRKAAQFLQAGIHLLIIDLFPPSRRDPQGIHKLIWDRIHEEDFVLPTDKPLTLAAYSAGRVLKAFVEPIAVGSPLPDMPIFLSEDHYVMCPLERTYQASWAVFPDVFKSLLEPSVNP